MLHNEFTALVIRYIPDTQLAAALWDDLHAAYTAGDRQFHNLAHLEQMLSALLAIREQADDWDTLLFALFYHDYVYDVIRYVSENDNEDRSAEKAGSVLAALGYAAEKIERCKQHIMATKAHRPSGDGDGNLLVDADLSVLGQSWEDYERYMKNIRKEYDVFPDSIYNAGRTNVLKNFLRSQRLFHTDHFHRRFEDSAKENVERELEILSFS